MSLAKERPVRHRRDVKPVRRRKKQTHWVVWIHQDTSGVERYYASLVPRRMLIQDGSVVDVVDPSVALSVETLETFVPASNAFVRLADALYGDERPLVELLENLVLAAWLIARKLEQ